MLFVETQERRAPSCSLAFPNVQYVPLEEVARMKAVPLDSDTLLTGRDIGICFGD